jgi:hypothetical protein
VDSLDGKIEQLAQGRIDPMRSSKTTTHRVMAAVFDGDPQPIYDIILDPAADEFVRSRMCENPGDIGAAERARPEPRHPISVRRLHQIAAAVGVEAAASFPSRRGTIPILRRFLISPGWFILPPPAIAPG